MPRPTVLVAMASVLAAPSARAGPALALEALLQAPLGDAWTSRARQARARLDAPEIEPYLAKGKRP